MLGTGKFGSPRPQRITLQGGGGVTEHSPRSHRDVTYYYRLPELVQENALSPGNPQANKELLADEH